MSDVFENFIRDTAQDLVYPAMPQKKAVYRQGSATYKVRYVAIVLLVIGLIGFAIPPIRATVLQFLQLGAVTIQLDGISTDGNPLRLSDVFGETELAIAQERVNFELRIPPDNLPDRVYLQDSALVIMVWLDGNDITQALYQISGFDWNVIKNTSDLDDVEETTVQGQGALWLDIPHPVRFSNGAVELTHFVRGHVLIWTNENETVTYRLETQLPLEQAQQFAESLVPLAD